MVSTQKCSETVFNFHFFFSLFLFHIKLDEVPPVRVRDGVCLITASVVVTALGYKHHPSRRDVTIFIAALFVRLLKRLSAKLSATPAEGEKKKKNRSEEETSALVSNKGGRLH